MLSGLKHQIDHLSDAWKTYNLIFVNYTKIHILVEEEFFVSPIRILSDEQYEYLNRRGYGRNFVNTYILNQVEDVVLPVNNKGGELIRGISQALPLENNPDYKVRLVVSQDLSIKTRSIINKFLNSERVFGEIIWDIWQLVNPTDHV